MIRSHWIFGGYSKFCHFKWNADFVRNDNSVLGAHCDSGVEMKGIDLRLNT